MIFGDSTSIEMVRILSADMRRFGGGIALRSSTSGVRSAARARSRQHRAVHLLHPPPPRCSLRTHSPHTMMKTFSAAALLGALAPQVAANDNGLGLT